MSATHTSHPATTSGRTRTQSLVVGVTLLLVGTLIILPSGLMTPQASPATATLDRALQTAATTGGHQPHRVIVSARSGLAQDAALAATCHGGQVIDRFDSIGAVTTVIRADRLAALASDARVRNLSSDGVVESAQYRGPTKRDTDAPTSITDPAPADDTAGGGDESSWSAANNHLLNTLA